MNRPELELILKKARLPEIPEESLEMFPRRIVARLKHNDSPARAKWKYSPRLAWAFGLAACIVITFAVGHWSGRIEAIHSNDVLADIKVVRETLAMFPNRVRAIVRDEGGMNLVLSDKEDVPVSTPIYVRICNGKQCSSLVTFSGQAIQIAGQEVTVLSEADGGIILEGSKFLWSSSEQIYAGNNLKIEAKNLGSVAM